MSNDDRIDLYYPPAQTMDVFLAMDKIFQSDFRNENIDETSNRSLNYFSKKYLKEEKLHLGDEENILTLTQYIATLFDYSKFTEKRRVPFDPCDERLLKFLAYCIVDTILPVKLCDKFNIIRSKRIESDIAKCPSENVFMQGITSQNSFTMFTQFRKNKTPITPNWEMLCDSIYDVGMKMTLIVGYYQNKSSMRAIKKPLYEGAIVVRKPGFHNDVTVLDFASLYPSCIKLNNISPETRIVRPQQLRLTV